MIKLTLTLSNREDQFKDGINLFFDPNFNEYHYTMSFVYPMFQKLFNDIPRTTLYQKWGEAHSDHIKAYQQEALYDSDRTSPSPSIDAIFTLYQLNKLGFFMIENLWFTSVQESVVYLQHFHSWP
jgi:hypothetical protein